MWYWHSLIVSGSQLNDVLYPIVFLSHSGYKDWCCIRSSQSYVWKTCYGVFRLYNFGMITTMPSMNIRILKEYACPTWLSDKISLLSLFDQSPYWINSIYLAVDGLLNRPVTLAVEEPLNRPVTLAGEEPLNRPVTLACEATLNQVLNLSHPLVLFLTNVDRSKLPQLNRLKLPSQWWSIGGQY